MAFEKTKAAVDSHGTDDESTEEEELKDVEETTDEQAQSSEKTQEAEAEVEKTEEQIDWKARALKAETEGENYKRGLLNERASKRQLEPSKPKVVEPAEEDEVEAPEEDISDQRIRKVIYQDNEKKALRSVVDSKSPLYIPELVEDANYNAVIAYLPHTIDKSSPETIHRALRVALQAWKYDNGIKDEPKDAGASAKASIAAVKSTTANSAQSVQKQSGRKILTSSSGMKDWYKKKT